MEGIRSDLGLRGVIPNSFSHIFADIDQADEGKQFLVRASYVTPQPRRPPSAGVFPACPLAFMMLRREDAAILRDVATTAGAVQFRAHTELFARRPPRPAVHHLTIAGI